MHWSGILVSLSILIPCTAAVAHSPQVLRFERDQAEVKFVFASPEGAPSVPEAFFLTVKDAPVTSPRIRVTQLRHEAAQLSSGGVRFELPPATRTLQPRTVIPVAAHFDPAVLSRPGSYNGRLVVEETVGRHFVPRLVLEFTVTRPEAKPKLVPEPAVLLVVRSWPWPGAPYWEKSFRAELWTSGASAAGVDVAPARLSSITDGLTQGRVTATFPGQSGRADIPAGRPVELELAVDGLPYVGKYEGTLLVQSAAFKDSQAVKTTVIVTDSLQYLAAAVACGVFLSLAWSALGRQRERAEEELALTGLRRRVASLPDPATRRLLLNQLDQAVEALEENEIARARTIRTEVERRYDQAAAAAVPVAAPAPAVPMAVAAPGPQPSLEIATPENSRRANAPIRFRILDPAPAWDAAARFSWQFGDTSERTVHGLAGLQQMHAYAYPGTYTAVVHGPAGARFEARVKISGDRSAGVKLTRWRQEVLLSAGSIAVGVASGMAIQFLARPDYFGTWSDYVLAILWGLGLDRSAKFEQVRKIFVRG
ncbi:MAG: hypothetical protein HY725_20785 [Candidatus Rokubacteria bacterium]|nr:hypothetical protein [Candidatus Rokubacteria bacterium]